MSEEVNGKETPDDDIRNSSIPKIPPKVKVDVKEDIRDNARRKLLIIGKTGTGKSTLCNVLTGNPFDSDIFPVSSDAESCTQKTKFCNAFFNGDKEMPVSIIDTIGFDDPSTDNDAETVAELVDKLKNACDHVNCFVLAVNGQNPRLDGSLVGMIRLFEGMFGEQFWEQMIVVFTRMPMDKKSVNKRKRNANNQSDDAVARKYMTTVESKFGDKAKGLQYLFIDACYDELDDDENNAFKKATQFLGEKILSSEYLPTTTIRIAETENQKLTNKIEKAEAERTEYELMAEKARAEQERIKLEHQATLAQIKTDQLAKEVERTKEMEQLSKDKFEAEKLMSEQEKKENDKKYQQELEEMQRKMELEKKRNEEKIKEVEKNHQKVLQEEKKKNAELDRLAKQRGFSWWDTIPGVNVVMRLLNS